MTLHITSGPLKPWRIAGRKSESEAIQNALTRRDKVTRILYFVAPAGIGKTRLLQETESMVKTSFSDSCQFGGFYDFSDTELHSNSRLEQRILDNLDPRNEKFTAYRVLRREFEEDRRVAPIPTRLDEKRRELGKLFVQGLNEISAQKKLVFCFDTLEALQYESDDIQRLIGPIIQQVAIETRNWLAAHLPAIENVVIVLAGRPKPSLEDYLKDAFASVEYQRIELSNFDAAAAQEYFTVMAETYEREQQPTVAQQMREMAKPEYAARAHALTEGRPLMLAFATDLLHYGRTLPDEFRPDSKLPADPKVLQGKLANAVMNDISSDIAQALPFIALASKGVDAELLERIMYDEVSPVWDRTKCEQVLQTLSALSYAKPIWDKEGKLVMRLHDEMADLLHNSEIHPHIDEYASKCAPIIDYYESKIKTAKAANNRSEEFRLTAEQLWYRFAQNPQKGYEAYSALFDRAIINRQIGLDMLVRDEMLRFFQPNLKENNNLERARSASNGALTAERINRGAGIRWVHRLVATGRFQDAITVAQKLKASDLQDPVEDPLFIPILDTWEGEAKAYLGVELADQIATLNRAIKGFDDAESKPKTEYMRKLWARNKGRAYNTRGYAYSGANESLQAVKDFRTALPYLRETGLPHQTAGTITNLAYDNLRTGQFLAAGILCREALRICEKHHLAFLKGLTLNTSGLVDLMADRPHRAVAWAQQAIAVFEGLQEGGERRGIGLAKLALGEAYRRIAKLGIYPHDQIMQFMQSSEQALTVGLDTFKADGPSPEQPREAEAHQELGCLYRQWARYLRDLANQDPSAIANLKDKSLQHLNAALALASAKNVSVQSDVLNDMAELYFVQEQFAMALKTLADSDAVIGTFDQDYLLTNGNGQPRNPMPNLFVILGKNSFLRGRMALRDKNLDEAAKHYTFASAYFDCFGGDQSAQEVTARRIYRVYEDLVGAGLDMQQLREFRQRVEEIEAQVLFNRPGFRRPTTLCHNFNDVLVIVSPIL